MATPSLAMIPSAIADSKVYSVLPNNGDGDFTFNRDSSATRVGQNGLIQTVGFFGNNFVTNGTFETDTDWTKGTGWTIGSGVASCDGVQTGSYLSQTSSSTLVLGKTYKVNFDLIHTSGTLLFMLASSNPLTNTSGNITTGGSKEFYITISSLSDQLIYFRSNLFNGSIDNVSVKEVTGDQPRLNYDISNGVVQSCPSLLLEPASTNLITYSEDFSQWTSDTNASITSNSIISPDGTQNADKLIAGSSTARQAIKFNLTASGDISAYVFAKKGEYTVIQLTDASSPSAFANFDLENGLVGSTDTYTANIENYGNGWFKCSITYNSVGSINSFRLSITQSSTSARLVNFAGNNSDGLYIYGAQVEQLSYATSYIPNSGQSAGVTRAAETCLDAGNASTFNDSEGVLYAEISKKSGNTATTAISLYSGSASNSVSLYYFSTTNVYVDIFNSSGTITMNIGTINTSVLNKIAVKYKNGDNALWLNGVEVATSSGAVALSGLDRIDFNYADGTSSFHGNTKDIRVYNEALTDAQLTVLTTI